MSLSFSPSPTQSLLKCLIHTDTTGLSVEKTAVSSASVATADHSAGHVTLQQLQFLSYTCSSVIRCRVLRLGVSVRTNSCKPQDPAFIKISNGETRVVNRRNYVFLGKWQERRKLHSRLWSRLMSASIQPLNHKRKLSLRDVQHSTPSEATDWMNVHQSIQFETTDSM